MTEDFTDSGRAHRRIDASLAFGLPATDWLSVAAKVYGRYDSHPFDSEGADDSWSGVPTLSLRAFDDSSELSYGLELLADFPGNDAPSVQLDATTVTARGLLAYEPTASQWLVAANLGYRMDNGAKAAPDPTTLRQGDRIALGINEYDAVVGSAGFGYRVSKGLLMLDFSAEILLGAEKQASSPKRVALGYRHQLSDLFQLEGVLHANLNSQPPVAGDSPLIAVEPRGGAWLGLRVAFGGDSPTAETEPQETAPDQQQDDPQAPSEPAAAEVNRAPVHGTILDASGQPLAQVDVTVRVGGEEFTTVTDQDGAYRFEGLPFGEAEVEATTVDYQPAKTKATVGGDGAEVELPALKMQLEALGAQIQGLVQTFAGKPLAAQIKISPPGKVYSAGADGHFTIDVTPGRYTVEISAKGYSRQKHVVNVEEKAVVVVNADLRESK